MQVWNDGGSKAFVFGHQFGPAFIALSDSVEDALSEWDERFGEPVEEDDPALSDYPGDEPWKQAGAAIDDGDIRVNDGGTVVWVDPYEWFREFEDIAEAFKYALGGWNEPL